FGLTEKIHANIPRVGLALSGGGARSISGVGVLRAFEEQNIPIEIIVGTSMGSIVGGLYSAGYSIDDLDSLLRHTGWDDFFSPNQSTRNDLFIDQKISEDRAIISFRMDGLNPIIPTSISSGQRAANNLNLLAINAPILSDDNFDNFLFRYRAVSADLISGKEILIDKGPLGLAMRASSSVTLLLPPVKRDSLFLIDGGLVANVPAKETRALGADIVVAVDASSPLYPEEELDVPWNIADQLVSIPMKILNDQQLKNADFIIRPEMASRKNSDFSDLKQVVKAGYDSAKPVAAEVAAAYKKAFMKNLSAEKKVFRNLTLAENAGEPSKKLFGLIASKDSASTGDLYYHLYNIYREGSWQDLSLEIEERGGKSFLTVNGVGRDLVDIINLEGTSDTNMVKALGITSGLMNRPFNPGTTLRAALEILRMYKREGFSLARIEKISFDGKTGELRIKISEGMISGIIVEGNIKTRERIITREFPLEKGEIFKYDLAETGLTNLRSTNLFDQIDLTITPRNGVNEVKLKVLEKVSNVIRLGARFDNENFTQLSIDLRDENFNGTATEFGATLSGGTRNRSLSIEQKANRVFDSFYTYKVRAFHEFNDVNVYKEDLNRNANRSSRSKTGEYRQIYYGGSFGVGAQVEKFGNILIEARYQRDEIKNKFDYTGTVYKKDISSLRFSLSIDSQNDYPYPTVGFLVKGSYETAQTALGGDIGYTKFYLDYKNIISYRSINTLSIRAAIGTADNTLPLSQQFSLGGQNSFFGLRENEFRGRQIFLTSLEYRYKIPFKIFFDTYVKARYDLGSIWEERGHIRFKDLKHGVGATISFNTPLGPADFSVGKSFYFINTLPNNAIVWSPTYFYFTIGYYY
ncbi:MAG: BamA/TamA family outer membrane protein, partial [Melioribacteraceae bacterium]